MWMVYPTSQECATTHSTDNIGHFKLNKPSALVVKTNN